MKRNRITVAWISDYPIEWLKPRPEALNGFVRTEPATWLPVLAAELAKSDAIRLHVIALRKGGECSVSFEQRGVHFHILKAPAFSRLPSLFWTDTLLIRRALASIRPDLVHGWGTERGEALVASRLGYPYVITVQGIMTWYRQAARSNLHQHLSAILEPISLRRARIATVESAFGLRYLKQQYPRLKVHQVEHAANLIFHGVDRKPKIDPPRFLNVAATDHRKGVDVLLHAFDRLRPELPFELLITGESSSHLVNSVRRELSSQLWERVMFKPKLSPMEIANELSQATMSVLPTRADTSPNAVKEAAVAGVPVIATSTGGIPEYIFPGRNGVLCAPGDVMQLVEAVRTAVRHPLFQKGQVDPSVLNSTRKYLHPHCMADRFLSVYQEALAEYESERFYCQENRGAKPSARWIAPRVHS